MPPGKDDVPLECLDRLDKMDEKIRLSTETVQRSTSTLAQEIAKVREDMKEQFYATNAAQAKENVELRWDVNVVKNDIKAVRDNMAEFKEDTHKMKTAVTSMATTLKVHSTIISLAGVLVSLFLGAYIKMSFESMAKNQEVNQRALREIQDSVKEGSDAARQGRADDQSRRERGEAE
jgi:hypothetical protein